MVFKMLEERVQVSKGAAWPKQIKDRMVRESHGGGGFSRECTTCSVGAGKSKQHRKEPCPDAYTLSLDLCGPVERQKRA